MSGTSLGSVDYALCRIGGNDGVTLEDLWTATFPPVLEARLQAAARGDASTHQLAQLHHDLGRFYATHARKAGRARLPLRGAGLHGLTVFHNPDRKRPATLQIGEPAYLARALGVPVVNNFRAADLAVGGQGAPLATGFHVCLFGRRGAHVCVNNLGGISNVTSIDRRRGRTPRVLAFDTGPANVLLDLAMRHFTAGRQTYDRGGCWAATGQVNETLLSEWLRHPFFARRPPKSTGREVFGEPFLARVLREARAERLSPRGTVATLTAFTARSLALNYRRHLPAAPDQVILTGGGAENPTLVAAIRRALSEGGKPTRVCTSAELGWPSQAIEPAAFAWLAWRRLRGRSGHLPETTGAERAVLLGQVTEL
ncbi:MAG TPA: anhydro-N-acetylmuramic acid kinase [Methylomirabilota bacterium]|nr:anhydro-N-acetylmuramic acid kinase [Methylomirabilota bacterium]